MVSLEVIVMSVIFGILFAFMMSLIAAKCFEHVYITKHISKRGSQASAAKSFKYVWPSPPWYGLPRKVEKHNQLPGNHASMGDRRSSYSAVYGEEALPQPVEDIGGSPHSAPGRVRVLQDCGLVP